MESRDIKKNHDILVNILQFVDSKSYWCSTAPWVATPFGYTVRCAVHSRKRFHFSIPSSVDGLALRFLSQAFLREVDSPYFLAPFQAAIHIKVSLFVEEDTTNDNVRIKDT